MEHEIPQKVSYVFSSHYAASDLSPAIESTSLHIGVITMMPGSILYNVRRICPKTQDKELTLFWERTRTVNGTQAFVSAGKRQSKQIVDSSLYDPYARAWTSSHFTYFINCFDADISQLSG